MGNLTTIRNSINALKSLGDPQKALEQLMQSNPHIKQALDYVNSNGGNPKEVCYKMLRENGVNPDDIEQALRL